MSVDCQQKNHLCEAWKKSTYLYDRAVKEFDDKLNVAFLDDLELLWGKVEQARKVTLHTRERYESHVSEHGC